jgi:hypothetical protein
MPPKVIDLSNLSSPPVPISGSQFTKSAASRTRASARGKTRAIPERADGISRSLRAAILNADAERMRTALLDLCAKYEAVRGELEGRWLVKGRDVIRYHEDTESECREEEESNEQIEEREVKPIKVADKDLTSRYVKCINCNSEFDVTTNNRRECQWHLGNSSQIPTEKKGNC